MVLFSRQLNAQQGERTDPTAPFRGSLRATLQPAHEVRPDGSRRKQAVGEIGLFQLPQAGQFSDDDCLGDPVALIREFLRHPFAEVLRDLTEGSAAADDLGIRGGTGSQRGRPREDGNWPALYLGFVLGRDPSLHAWVKEQQSSTIWRVCGFRRPLSYPCVYLRFRELEEHWQAFAFVAQALIFSAKQRETRIGQIVVVDATHSVTSAKLEHCCPDAHACDRAGTDPVRHADEATVKENRWREADEDEPLDGEGLPPDPERNRQGIEVVRRWDGRELVHATFYIQGHWYRSLDLDAGVRRYDNGKAWPGFFWQTAGDAFTGSPLSVEVFPADVQEFDGYSRLFEHLVAAIGEPPRIVSTDKHYSFRGFYEWNTRRGVAVVGPRKTRSNRKTRADWRTDMYDEDGIPRCRHCGGEGDQDGPGLGLSFSRSGDPGLRYRCLVPFDSACAGVQFVCCSEEWLMLIALSRKTELYHAIRRITQHNKENIHEVWRKRYLAAGKDGSSRLCRPGIGPQRLRAWSCVLLDWFRLSLRNGWLDPIELPVKLNGQAPKLLSGIQDRRTGAIVVPGDGTEWLHSRLTLRREAGTHLPYGPQWDICRARTREAQEPEGGMR
jgi:hypothetical protein